MMRYYSFIILVALPAAGLCQLDYTHFDEKVKAQDEQFIRAFRAGFEPLWEKDWQLAGAVLDEGNLQQYYTFLWHRTNDGITTERTEYFTHALAYNKGFDFFVRDEKIFAIGATVLSKKGKRVLRWTKYLSIRIPCKPCGKMEGMRKEKIKVQAYALTNLDHWEYEEYNDDGSVKCHYRSDKPFQFLLDDDHLHNVQNIGTVKLIAGEDTWSFTGKDAKPGK